MSSAYERRNERAREAGWSGYGQQRNAARLGYSTPGEYAAAKAISADIGSRATIPATIRAERAPSGGKVFVAAGDEVPGRDVNRDLSDLLGGGLPSRERVDITIDGVTVTGRGISAGYLRELIDAAGDLETAAASLGYGDGVGEVSVSVG